MIGNIYTAIGHFVSDSRKIQKILQVTMFFQKLRGNIADPATQRYRRNDRGMGAKVHYPWNKLGLLNAFDTDFTVVIRFYSQFLAVV